MASEFENAFKAFEERHVKRVVKRFWEAFDKLELSREDAEDWCVTAQYGLNMRTIFDAIDDEDWKDVEEAIERVNMYAS